MMTRPCRGGRGASLIELLLVVAILGIVMTAIYSLFRTQRNNAYSQVEVVEVQQNLRIAMDTISRDLRNAGILQPAGTNQSFASPTGSPAFPAYSTNIRMNVSSNEGRFARVAFTGYTTQTGYSTPNQAAVTLTVERAATATSPNVVDGFNTNDIVRIIRPVDGSQPIAGGTTFIVTGKNRTAPSITIQRQDTNNFVATDIVANGDMIAKVPDAATYPVTVDYYLVAGNGTTSYNGVICPNNQRCLVRRVNGTPDIIASNVSTLKFSYLNDTAGIEETVPSDLTQIRAIRITLQGATATTAALSEGARSRGLTTVIKLRNRR